MEDDRTPAKPDENALDTIEVNETTPQQDLPQFKETKASKKPAKVADTKEEPMLGLDGNKDNQSKVPLKTVD